MHITLYRTNYANLMSNVSEELHPQGVIVLKEICKLLKSCYTWCKCQIKHDSIFSSIE